MAEYKNNKLEEFNKTNIEIGECGYVSKALFNSYNNKGTYYCIVIDKKDENIVVKINSIEHSYIDPIIIDKTQFKRDIRNIGYNPFVTKGFMERLIERQYDISSILYNCGYDKKTNNIETFNYKGVNVNEINFNPHVVDKNNEKQYFQRDFVWSLKDKQKFIESIYNNVHCGSIVLRKRSYEYITEEIDKGNTKDLGFYDVIDGKQRLKTLLEFVNDEFCDSNGFYYSDLSIRATQLFLNSRVITYIEMEEKTSDKDALNCFIMLNSTGVTISEDYIDNIKTIEL